MQTMLKTQISLLILYFFEKILAVSIIIKLQKIFNYAPLVTFITIKEGHIHMKKQSITRDSKEEKDFIIVLKG